MPVITGKCRCSLTVSPCHPARASSCIYPWLLLTAEWFEARLRMFDNLLLRLLHCKQAGGWKAGLENCSYSACALFIADIFHPNAQRSAKLHQLLCACIWAGAEPITKGGKWPLFPLLRPFHREHLAHPRLDMARHRLTSNCKINGHLSIQNRRFSRAILHYLCIFNRKIRTKLAFILQFAVPIAPFDWSACFSSTWLATCNRKHLSENCELQYKRHLFSELFY